MNKNAVNESSKSKFYFWRDKPQNEIDLLIENGSDLHALEIKSGKMINTNFFKTLDYFKMIKEDTQLHLVYGGSENKERTKYKSSLSISYQNFK